MRKFVSPREFLNRLMCHVRIRSVPLRKGLPSPSPSLIDQPRVTYRAYVNSRDSRGRLLISVFPRATSSTRRFYHHFHSSPTSIRSEYLSWEKQTRETKIHARTSPASINSHGISIAQFDIRTCRATSFVDFLCDLLLYRASREYVTNNKTRGI